MIITSDKYDGDRDSAKNDLVDVLDVTFIFLKIEYSPMIRLMNFLIG